MELLPLVLYDPHPGFPIAERSAGQVFVGSTEEETSLLSKFSLPENRSEGTQAFE